MCNLHVVDVVDTAVTAVTAKVRPEVDRHCSRSCIAKPPNRLRLLQRSTAAGSKAARCCTATHNRRVTASNRSVYRAGSRDRGYILSRQQREGQRVTQKGVLAACLYGGPG
jgi:hypothetical protein